MRDYTRRQVAQAKSRRATPEELREAKERLKEIDAELSQIALAPQTRNGEEREQRYQRVLKLRAMRKQFTRRFPAKQPRRMNSLMLSLVMTVAAFMFCAICAGTTYASLALLNQKPDPVATANDFWTAMEAQDYPTAHDTYFSPNLRFQRTQQDFIVAARQADANYGTITDAKLLNKSGDLKQTANLVYTVTRGGKVTYKVTLVMVLYQGTWGVDDLGSAINPETAGAPAVKSTAMPAATAGKGTPAATATKKKP